jgi:propionate kinase
MVSSSIKFSVLDAASCDCLLNGVAEGINADQASLSLKFSHVVLRVA